MKIGIKEDMDRKRKTTQEAGGYYWEETTMTGPKTDVLEAFDRLRYGPGAERVKELEEQVKDLQEQVGALVQQLCDQAILQERIAGLEKHIERLEEAAEFYAIRASSDDCFDD